MFGAELLHAFHDESIMIKDELFIKKNKQIGELEGPFLYSFLTLSL